MSAEKKALIVATVWPFYNFLANDIRVLQDLGYQVHCATNFHSKIYRDVAVHGVIKHDICFSRSPFSKNNIQAYRQLKAIIKENRFQIIHCHTPVAGILARLAARNERRKGTKVLYTSHGYHFHRGGSKKNWLIYYPIEKLCSRMTDIIITINEEDYALTKKKFHTKVCYRIPGVGIECARFELENFDTKEYKRTLGISEDDRVIISVGEVNTNKNHSLIIRSIAQFNDPDIHYFIAGNGNQMESNAELARSLGIENQVHFLGYRTDIPQLDTMADIFAFPALREGLGLAPIEAMACGTPVIGMDTRGVREYVRDGETGYKFDNSVSSCVQALGNCFKLLEKPGLQKTCKLEAKKYCRENSERIMCEIYRNI